MKFSTVTLDSLSELQELAKRTFIDAFGSQNDPKDFKHYLSTAFSLKTLAKEMETSGTLFYFVENGDAIVGYFKTNEFDSQTELKEPNGMELERIYVVKEAQSKGLGRDILYKVEELAREKSKDYLWLGVWEENTRAIRFYQKNGFVKFGEHPYYIGKDEQTDWLMKKTL